MVVHAVAPKKGKPTIETLHIFYSETDVQFYSGLVDLVVCIGRHFGGGHHLTLVGKRVVIRSPRTSRRWATVKVSSGMPAMNGLRAKPTMVADGS